MVVKEGYQGIRISGSGGQVIRKSGIREKSVFLLILIGLFDLCGP